MAKRTAGREAHLYALLNWWGVSSLEEALTIVDNTPYSDLDAKSYAETSITQAIAGIQKEFGGENLTPESDFSQIKVDNTPETYDKIVERILAPIHDKWVVENAKKYMRDKDESGSASVGSKSEKKLYQHLPAAMIGLDEISLDLMFLAPFLKEMGLDAGEMNLEVGGGLKPSKQLADAYGRYVAKYMEKHQIYSKEDLEAHIQECINGGYASLAQSSDVAKNRVAYMGGKTELLASEVAERGPEFAALQSASQPE